MNHLNSLITNDILIKQFANYYTGVKSERSNQTRWERFIDVGKSGERKYRIKMRQLFDAQLDDIIKNLARNSYKADTPVMYVDENNLCDWNDYRIQYNLFGQLELPGIMTAWADLELEALEVGLSFDVILPDVLTAITNRANLFSDSVINETRQALHKIITDSVNTGDGITQLERKIRGLYENMGKARAIRIARTEMIWAQNEGAEQSYIQSGVVEFKEWWTARDERRCVFCSTMHGKRIRLGENYFTQGESLTVNKPQKSTPYHNVDGSLTKLSEKINLANGRNKDGSPTMTMQFNYENVRHPPLHPHCYSVNTEIYTKDGWKPIYKVEKDERVLSLVPETKDLEWTKVTETVKRFSSTIFHLQNKQRSFEMMVTGDHPFFGYKRVDEGKKGRNIKPVWFDGVHSLNSEFKFYLSSKYFRLSLSHIAINGTVFETKQFCKFMGYYLSEGSVCKRKGNKYQISIAQSHYLDEMWDDLKGLPVRKIWLGKDRITIKDQGLGLYLEQFGKSNEKYVPEEIKNLSPMDIRVFLDAYRMGDGHKRKAKEWKNGKFKDSSYYFTCSDKMASDLGELIIKTGQSVSYSVNRSKGVRVDFKNGSYIGNHDVWIVSELTSQYRGFNNVSVEEIPYNDLVYDIEVEKNHTILTRYNGRVVWGSNCRCTLIPITYNTSEVVGTPKPIENN